MTIGQQRFAMTFGKPACSHGVYRFGFAARSRCNSSRSTHFHAATSAGFGAGSASNVPIKITSYSCSTPFPAGSDA